MKESSFALLGPWKSRSTLTLQSICQKLVVLTFCIIGLFTISLLLPQYYYSITVNEQKQLIHESDELETMRKFYASQAKGRKDLLSSPQINYGILYNVFVPEVYCPNLVRIGNLDDGGKWVCNPYNLPKIRKCAIFSLGINNDISFDVAFQEATNKICRLYAFDKDWQNQFVMTKLSEMNGEFKIAYLGDVDNITKNAYTIESLLNFYGLSKVEILKMDIEGAEFMVIPALIKSAKVCQILVEIHGNAMQMITLLKKLSAHDYYMFSYEINGYHHNLCEFSFIHKSCLNTYNAKVLAKYLT